MKVLLAAVNAKYIHSNPAVYSLKAYAEKRLLGAALEIEIGEYTINHRMELILQDIYRRKPDLIGFSCYIWNISQVRELIGDLHKVLPETEIWLGGPEVSYDARRVLEENPRVRGVMRGEGEKIFANVLAAFGKPESLRQVSGITFRDLVDSRGTIVENPPESLLELDELPFYYKDMSDFENRIVYYESSRGCPFSCSYCLSSIDKSVRFRSLELVKQELDFFLERKVPQVKFVDRTFNCKREHTMGIWQHLLDHDNGVTNFHFEVSADLFTEDELELISNMRPGLIQLEIGVQSTNPSTIKEIRRVMDLEKLAGAVARVKGFHNTHQHLDLIAGLPYEDLESFLRSFDDVYRMGPDQLQLGFLKVLKGSYMESRTEAYGLQYRNAPPYEVLSTDWLDYGQIICLKGMEEMVETYYNSGQFTVSMGLLEAEFERPSEMFLALSSYYEAHGLFGPSQSRLTRYEIFYDFICRLPGMDEKKKSAFRDGLTTDLYLRENAKSRLSFSMDQQPHKMQIRQFFEAEKENPRWLTDYDGFDARQIAKMAHLEAMEDGSFLLFDYRRRDPLSGNARALRFYLEEKENGSQRDKEGQRQPGTGDPRRPGPGVWNRVPLLSES